MSSTKTRKRRPSNESLARTQSLESLALELYGVVCRALTLYGLPIPRQKQLFRSTFRKTKLKATSSSLLEQFRSLSDLLSTWLEDLPYIDANGRPKILPIRGRGATFESLARQFLPDKSLEETVKLACRTASVGKVSGGRIAVYGDPMVNFSTWPEASLAQTISHVRHIIETCDINQEARRRDPSSARLERLVNEKMTPEQFEIVQRLIQPQLHAFCEHANRLLQRSIRKGRLKGRGLVTEGGLGIYLYYDDADSALRRLRRKPLLPVARP